MLARSEIFDSLADWRAGASLDWVTAQALKAGPYIDRAGVYHPEFVLNFRKQGDHGSDYSDLHFGSRFAFRSLPELDWVNEQNRRLRFTKLARDENGLVLTADLYGPDDALELITFEGTFVLFDQALVIIRAMATD